MVPEIDENAVTHPGAAMRGRTGMTVMREVSELLRHPVVRVISRRLVLSVPLLFVVSALSFVLISLTPGDAANSILGVHAAPAQFAQLRHALGLDQPIYQQYWHWLRHALRGDLGSSVFTNEPVTHEISGRLPVTLSLIAGAVVLSLIVGVTLGVLSALRGGVVGRAVDAFALLGFALPGFWVGAELIVFFAVKHRWFPATGYVPLSQSPQQWARSLVLPVIALSLGGGAVIAKQTRESMLDVLGSEHIRMAWANGLSPRSIVFRHALKNASVTIVTVLGIQTVSLLGATILVESIFALPGLGGLVVSASLDHDLPTVTGIAVYFTVIVVFVNLLIDLAYTVLNPRVRAG